MTQVKVCGLCSAHDAASAVGSGARYLGVVLSARGPRAQEPSGAAAVLRERGRAAAVGVFVDEAPERVAELAELLALDVIQLHGDEAPTRIAALRRLTRAAVWKAIRVRDAAAARHDIVHYAEHVDGVLLDGWSPGAVGGTGTRFAWDALTDVRSVLPAGVQLIVAGGLHAGNVGEAIAALQPDVVDVSSGVEVRPGEKSETKVRAFIASAQRACKEAAD